MINVFQGSLGSGKSSLMVVAMIEHLKKGGVVASNFSLVEDWAERVANYNLLVKLGLRDPARVAASLRSRFRLVQSVEEIWKASEELIPFAESPIKSKREGHGLLFLDEAQNIFNARKWSNNDDWIHFFTQSRKLKWDVILGAHSIKMIDKQIHYLLGYETRFRNMSEVNFLGIPCGSKRLPWFLGITRYAGVSAGSGEVSSRSAYPLIPALANLYDTALVFYRDGKPIEAIEPGVPERSEAVASLDCPQVYFCAFPKTLVYPRSWGSCTSFY